MSGIAGIYSSKMNNAAEIIYYALYALQHRGQISAGITVNNNNFIDYHKDMGLVHEIFSKDILERLKGNIAIGHVRYGKDRMEKSIINSQPIAAGYKGGALAIAHDGSIVNFKKLKLDLEETGALFQSEMDTEVIANLIARNSSDGINSAVIKTLEIIKGSYALIIMTNDRIIGARDPYGLKPLAIGKLNDDYVLASETCAFDTMGAKFIRDVEPGEVVVIDKDGLKTLDKKSEKRRLCIFELIYLARPDSKIDGKSVYLDRIEAGRQLAREAKVDADIVIGAPDSGIVAAIGYAEESGIPYAEGLIKNRYVGRTFIQPSQEMRELGVRIKLNPLKENINGKSLVLVDDSIVRGTTMRKIVTMLKDAGAKEVHVMVASPLDRFPCHLGLDTPDEKNLIANSHSVEEIKEITGADSLHYISIEGLIKASGNGGFCTGCFTNDYPIQKEVKNGDNL